MTPRKDGDASPVLDVDRVRALLAGASPGPWELQEGDTDSIEVRAANDWLVWWDVLDHDDEISARQRGDLALVIAGPWLAELVLAQAAAIENERDRADRMRALVGAYQGMLRGARRQRDEERETIDTIVEILCAADGVPEDVIAAVSNLFEPGAPGCAHVTPCSHPGG